MHIEDAIFSIGLHNTFTFYVITRLSVRPPIRHTTLILMYTKKVQISALIERGDKIASIFTAMFMHNITLNLGVIRNVTIFSSLASTIYYFSIKSVPLEHFRIRNDQSSVERVKQIIKHIDGRTTTRTCNFGSTNASINQSTAKIKAFMECKQPVTMNSHSSETSEAIVSESNRGRKTHKRDENYRKSQLKCGRDRGTFSRNYLHCFDRRMV